MDNISIIGYMATIIGTIGLVPQAVLSWKTKKVEDISKLTFTLLAIAYLSWLIYGLLIHDLPLIMSNFITLLLAGEVLYIKIKYGQ